MAAADSTTNVMLQMLEETLKQRRADQERMLEQRRDSQETLKKLEEQRITSEERNSKVMQIMCRELCTGRVPSATYTSADRFLT